MPAPLVWKPRALDADAFTARKPNAVRGQYLLFGGPRVSTFGTGASPIPTKCSPASWATPPPPMRPRRLRRLTPTSSTVDNSPVSAMDRAFSKALDKAVSALRRPDAKLVRQHGGTTAGFYVCLPHDSFRVRDEVAAKLLERDDVQPFDPRFARVWGPQSWRLGNWREWTR